MKEKTETQQPSTKNSAATSSQSKPPLLWVLFLLLLIVVYAAIDQFYLTPKIAYIDSGKLMTGFSEAAKVDNLIKTENEKWQTQLKELQDSLQVSIDAMSKEYNEANAARKKELQDMLSARNQEINNFRQANMRRMEQLQQKEMTGVYSKANLFISEYGKKHRYSIIFGTVTGGSIMYGDVARYDISSEIIKGLNERYK